MNIDPTILLAQREALEKLQHLTQDELDAIGESGKTTLIEHFVKPSDFTDCELPAGWKAVYVGCMESGSVGRVLLLPNHDWSRQVWRKGQIKFAVDGGLTPEQAELWISSSVTQRHRFFELLVTTLSNKSHVEGYLEYDVNSDSQEALKWSARFGITDNLALPRRVLFIQLLKDVLGLTHLVESHDASASRPWDINNAA